MTRVLPLLLLAGCVIETGNPELDVSLAVTGTSTTERVAVDGVPELEVTGAYVIVDDTRLVEAEGCETAAEVEYGAEGPFAVDLLAADPFTVTMRARATDYCRLRVRLDRADGTPAGFPAGMDDNAVYLEGTRADGVPFVLRSREKFEFDLRNDAGFPLDEGNRQLVLAFDLGTWLTTIDLASASPGGDGVVRVDEDNNESLLERFEEGVESILELYDDEDGDGDVDDDDGSLAD